ncbi:MAG TPA: EF-hand domain-containing protein [Lacunisphaera sp.]|jgi:Ca2+-binding EF-hand superfamily protein
MSISGISSGNRPDFSQIQQSIFDNADSNGDGSIDSSEFDSMVQNSPRLGNSLSSLVTNADGSKATPDQIFKAVDTDGDGKISVDELKGAMKTAHTHGHGGHHRGAPPVSNDNSSDDSSDSSTNTISSTINQIFKLLDTDGDGQVSSTELGAAMSSLSAASGPANSSSGSSGNTSTSSDGSSSTDATTAVSNQTASLQALLQQLMTQIQQQQASYTQNGAATDAGGMPSFFKVSA